MMYDVGPSGAKLLHPETFLGQIYLHLTSDRLYHTWTCPKSLDKLGVYDNSQNQVNLGMKKGLGSMLENVVAHKREW